MPPQLARQTVLARLVADHAARWKARPQHRDDEQVALATQALLRPAEARVKVRFGPRRRVGIWLLVHKASQASRFARLSAPGRRLRFDVREALGDHAGTAAVLRGLDALATDQREQGLRRVIAGGLHVHARGLEEAARAARDQDWIVVD